LPQRALAVTMYQRIVRDWHGNITKAPL